MVSIDTFKQMALALPNTEQQPHFDKDSFRVNKKIFATLTPETGIVSVKLSAVDQSVFCAYDKTVIYPVDNKWGKQGWTLINLKKVRKDMLKDILTTAYTHVSTKKKGS